MACQDYLEKKKTLLDFFKPVGKARIERLERVSVGGIEKVLFKNISGPSTTSESNELKQQKLADDFLGVSRINKVGAVPHETLNKRKLSDQAVEIWRSRKSMNETPDIVSIIAEINPLLSENNQIKDSHLPPSELTELTKLQKISSLNLRRSSSFQLLQRSFCHVWDAHGNHVSWRRKFE
jgi:hypothetical protein